MKSYVKVKFEKEDLYLSALFPVKWSAFISEARYFLDEQDARLQLNSRYSKISESLNNSKENIQSITIVTYNNGKLISETQYLGESIK